MQVTAAGADERIAALTFDIDTLARDLYRPALTAAEVRRLEDLSFDVVVPRIAAWLDRVGVRATFFIVGDYARRYRSVIGQLARGGHEIASHSDSHPRNFSMLGRADVDRELKAAHEALFLASGAEPIGFRAPGFTTSPALIEGLTELGYAYDSSVVPSWSYTTLKHVYRTARLASSGYLYPESYRCVTAPQIPYRTSAASRYESHVDTALLEIPITTATVLQWPMIHGLHARAHGRWRLWMEQRALWRPFALMVFHDLEFAAAADLRGLPVGTLTAPHVRVPLEARLARIDEWIRTARLTHRFAPLREVAEAYLPECVSIAR